jgi:DNA-binding winged helix-turn-helix (wHTH) protein/TolB-like protein/Flp pilus assembly protein TadD
MNPSHEQIFRFADLELNERKRSLLRSGKPLILNAKAFDLLLFLLENAGRVVSKDEILDAVWKDQFVEESNLSVQVSALRKSLDDTPSNPQFLATIPGKGYQFVADVTVCESGDGAPQENSTSQNTAAEEFAEPNLPRGRVVNYRRLKAAGVIATVTTAAIVFSFFGRGLFQTSSQRSIAVLPFVIRDDGPPDGHLSDGLAESVIFSLSRLPELKVLSRDSSFRYRDAAADAKAIGQELKVGTVLTGRIARTGDSVSVSAELVSTADNSVIWGEQFSRPLVDVEKLQIDIARSVARQLRITLGLEEQTRLADGQTDDHEAYKHFLEGRFHLNRLTDDGFYKARDSFRSAIDRDPNYALAYAGLAESYNLLSGWGATRPNDTAPLAKAAAMRSLEIDEALADGHVQLGIVRLFYDIDLRGADEEFIRAIELNGSSSEAHHMYAYSLMIQGRFDDARKSIARAIDLDPLSVLIVVSRGNTFTYERRFQDAIAEYSRAVEMDPNSGLARWSLGNALMFAGNYAEAIEQFEKSILLSGESPDEPAALAYALARSGNRGRAREILNDLTERAERQYLSPGLLAIINGSIGDLDEAFSLLDAAVNERDHLLVFMGIDPYFDPLRSDPRFAEIMRRQRMPFISLP